jgi:hypothetical protein
MLRGRGEDRRVERGDESEEKSSGGYVSVRGPSIIIFVK